MQLVSSYRVLVLAVAVGVSQSFASASQLKGKDTSTEVSKNKTYVEALDGHGVAMYDLRLIGKQEIWKMFGLPPSALAKLDARLAAAQRDARREVPELDLPPLTDDALLSQSVIQERYRLIELNAEEFGAAYGRWAQKHTLAFLFEDLTAVQRVRAMQSMNQIAGPSPKLLKVVGLSEEESATYIKELIAMRQQAIK